MRNKLIAFAMLCFAPAWAEQGSDPFETTISEKSDADSKSLSSSRLQTPNPEEALGESPGTALIRSGGPLAQTRISRRGLSGQRTHLSLWGMTLNDPLTGAFDVASLPFSAVDSIAHRRSTTGLESMQLGRDAPSLNESQGSISAGSFGTLRSRAALNLQSNKHRFFFALDAGTTQGNFDYRLETSSGAQFEKRARTNNDQARASALAFHHYQGRVLSWQNLVRASIHRGGIPGFASRPTANLRADDWAIQARSSLTFDSMIKEVWMSPHITRQSRRSDDAQDQTLLGSSASAGATIQYRVGGLRMHSPLSVLYARALTAGAQRVQVNVPLEATLDWGQAQITAGATGAWISDQAPLLNAELRVRRSLGPLSLHAGLAHRSRPPTLDEKYAPRGVVLANPNLKNEITSDAELGARLRLGRQVHASFSAYAGLIEDAILYVNHNAYDVSPINTGGGQRFGFEASLRVRAHRYLTLDVVSDALVSELDGTQGPLPLSPRFRGALGARLGVPDAHLKWRLSHRGRSAANLFGTVENRAYNRLDVAIVLNTLRPFTLQLGCDNLLNVNATDANLMPLPGRNLYLTLGWRI